MAMATTRALISKYFPPFIKQFYRWFLKTLTFCLVSDRQYAEEHFPEVFDRHLNLDKPRTFNEKIQWLKLYYRVPIMAQLVDKYAVRGYVKGRIGDDYLKPLLGLYETVDDLVAALPSLPDQVALKATHGSGWNLFLDGRKSLTVLEIEKIRIWLNTSYYELYREWCYKSVPRRIMAEKLIVPNDPELGVLDYKLFCFNGEPMFVQLDVSRFGNHRRNLYDITFKRLPVRYEAYPGYDGNIQRPRHFDEMIEIAKQLSRGFPFVRIDFFEEQEILFGEMTFYPANGFGPFDPPQYDYAFGNLLQLPQSPMPSTSKDTVYSTPQCEE